MPPKSNNSGKKTRKRPRPPALTEASTTTHPRAVAVTTEPQPQLASSASPIVPIRWPPTPPNCTAYRSIVQETKYMTAEELGLPPGVSPPIVALPGKRRPGCPFALPEVVLPPGVIPPWEDDPLASSITLAPSATSSEVATPRADFSSRKRALSPSDPPLLPDPQQTDPVDTFHTALDAHVSKRRRVDTNLDRPISSAQPLLPGGTPSSFYSDAIPPAASASCQESISFSNTPYGWYPDQASQQSHHDIQSGRYNKRLEAQLQLMLDTQVALHNRQCHAQLLDQPSYVQGSSRTPNFDGSTRARSFDMEAQTGQRPTIHDFPRTPPAGGR